MDKESIIAQKSFVFATRIIKAVRFIKEQKREYELANQLLRSGTSIGANVSEAKYGQSDKDFISKHKIALKEASETRYWLRLMEATDILSYESTKSLITDIEEIIKILTSIINSMEKRQNKQS